MKKRKKEHNDLHCVICGTDIEVPMCCGRDMSFKGGMLVCDMCGNEQKVPVCCGREMALAGA